MNTETTSRVMTMPIMADRVVFTAGTSGELDGYYYECSIIEPKNSQIYTKMPVGTEIVEKEPVGKSTVAVLSIK